VRTDEQYLKLKFSVPVPTADMVVESVAPNSITVARVRHVLSGFDLELYSAVDALEQIRSALDRG
jgi:hypothetical protein